MAVYLSTGIGSELQKESFFPFVLILYMRKKKSMKLVLKRMEMGWGQELPKT